MKRFIAVFIILIMCSAVSVSADGVLPFRVTLDGRELSFEQPPVIDDDRVMVPIRAIFEALGAEMSWDDDTRVATATKDATTVVVDMGKIEPEVHVNGLYVWCDIPPKIVNDRIMVPVRVISQSFATLVGWENETRTVTITSYDKKSLELFEKFNGVWINSDYIRLINETKTISQHNNYQMFNFYNYSVAKMDFHSYSDFERLALTVEIAEDVYKINPAVGDGSVEFFLDERGSNTKVTMNGIPMQRFDGQAALESYITRLFFSDDYVDDSGNRIRIKRIWLDNTEVPGEDCIDGINLSSSEEFSYIYEYSDGILSLYELVRNEEFNLYEQGELKYSLRRAEEIEESTEAKEVEESGEEDDL